jgi:hypothetical protein
MVHDAVPQLRVRAGSGGRSGAWLGLTAGKLPDQCSWPQLAPGALRSRARRGLETRAEPGIH